MRRSRRIIVAVGLSLILGAQAVFIVMLSTRDGARVKSPDGSIVLDRSFIAAGDAWMREGVARVVVSAVPLDGQEGATVSFEAARDAVRYRGQVQFLLSTWSVRVQLPSDGRWELWAEVEGIRGGTARAGSRVLDIRAGSPVREFRSWTPEHLVPLAVIVAVSIGLALAARRTGSFDRFALVMTLCLWTNEFAYQLYYFLFARGWAAPTALMLQMCGLSILLLPVMLFCEKPGVRQFLFDILYFWGIGGAIQALIAPDIGASGFPTFRYVSFFVSHGLIIACTALMAAAGGVRLTFRSFARALVVTNLLLLPVYGIDQALRLVPPYDPGNYFVLGYPPPTGSVVDVFAEVFGPSPRYVVGLELMGIAVFMLLYLPWPIARRLTAKRAAVRAA
ncbi:MAG: TIGR02206 family membrane protein [Spirochaetes bacterium]|nr:TIGR02206 family membrane protein [Spirochaetota bacterium]